MAPGGCAVGPDGKLLDASEIDWFRDRDDVEPMVPANTSSTVQTSLDAFLTEAPAPSARRSNRVPQPSAKAIDPNNAMATKRKLSGAQTPNPSRRLRQASPEHEDNRPTEPDATEPGSSDGADTEEDVLVDSDKETEALEDTDHKVCVHFPSQFID
jgi:hypothetical protein